MLKAEGAATNKKLNVTSKFEVEILKSVSCDDEMRVFVFANSENLSSNAFVLTHNNICDVLNATINFENSKYVLR